MPSSIDRRRIDEATKYFMSNQDSFNLFAQSLMDYFKNNPKLGEFIYSIKYRIKDERSLRAKLERISTDSSDQDLASQITDFAGLRIIHLHMDQLATIHPLVLGILEEHECQLLKSPKAYYWDLEYENLFRKIDIKAVQRNTMYTAVHYDIRANQRNRITCELQVRSLTEELWGEVSHKVNYPKKSSSESCQDQLKALARLTAGCGRLVDSIFKTHHGTVK